MVDLVDWTYSYLDLVRLRRVLTVQAYRREHVSEPWSGCSPAGMMDRDSQNPIAEEVQKMNQVAFKIALAPDDVHDEEYHTMIEGMLSNKEFRKTLPAGLVEQYYDLTCGYSRPDQFGPATSSLSESDNLNLFNGNLITILMNETKKATNATAAILGNHSKTTTPSTFLTASTSQQSKEGSMSMARDILLGNRNIDTLFQPSTHSQKQSNQECCYLSGGFDRADLILAWIDASNYDGTSLGLNVVNPSTNDSQNLSNCEMRHLDVDPNHNLVKQRSAPRPSSLQQNGKIVHEEENGGKKDLTSKIVKVLPAHEQTLYCSWQGTSIAARFCFCLLVMTLVNSKSMEKIKGTPKLKVVVVVYCIRARDLRDKLFMEEMCHSFGIFVYYLRDPGQVLIDDQLAKQLGVTTRTDDQVSCPSVTPIKDSIGHHPPKQVGNGGKRLTKRWDCPETDYADHHKLDPDPDSLNTPPHNILNFKQSNPQPSFLKKIMDSGSFCLASPKEYGPPEDPILLAAEISYSREMTGQAPQNLQDGTHKPHQRIGVCACRVFPRKAFRRYSGVFYYPVEELKRNKTYLYLNLTIEIDSRGQVGC
ncbi:hypothetical protein PPACK8108_LOCUS18049 [Phakopsora pachyrhizi]|uniref:Uncharacterized protein n=1 Tax=Phakopsora pachyrhizi TaxID=170000 RepID=A0AAV0BDX1_PHAPC|nr:hypothetical protein PPACK8108_LOCUS18049 [Phakopsora pachyrhizi]